MADSRTPSRQGAPLGRVLVAVIGGIGIGLIGLFSLMLLLAALALTDLYSPGYQYTWQDHLLLWPWAILSIGIPVASWYGLAKWVDPARPPSTKSRPMVEDEGDGVWLGNVYLTRGEAKRVLSERTGSGR